MMAKGIQIFPYPISTRLETVLKDFDDPVTGKPITLRRSSDDAVDRGDDFTSFYDITDTGWRKLTFRAVVTLGHGELQRVLPATSDLARDVKLTVAVTCPTTKYRHGFVLTHGKDGAWSGYITLQSTDVDGRIFLRATLARGTEIPPSSQTPFAHRLGAVIGLGETITIYLKRRDSSFQGAIPITWEDFANSENEWRRTHAEDVYHLEPYSDASLYLNSRYSQLREILDSTAKRGQEATLRDLTGVMIAQPVLLQLTLSALGAVELDDETGDTSLPAGWRGDLLQSVLPRVYPDVGDSEDRLRRAAQDLRESGGMASLISRLGSAVQETVANYKVVENAIRSYEGSRSREEGLDG
jgi:hypothetical protein